MAEVTVNTPLTISLLARSMEEKGCVSDGGDVEVNGACETMNMCFYEI